MAEKQMTMQDMPDILSASQIAAYLQISRRRVYELLDLKPAYVGIPNFHIGASRRVRKERFLEWLEQKEQES